MADPSTREPRRRWRALLGLGASLSRILRPIILLLAPIYLVGVSVFLVIEGSFPTPDFLIPPLMLVAFALGRWRQFMLDWLPFLCLLLLYEGLRGMADDIGTHVYIQSLIAADQWLLGSDKTGPNLLQEWLYVPGQVTWYDWLARVLYTSHFGVPIAFGFGVWLKDRATFWRFSLTMFGLYYTALGFFFLYPAAPPWMASDMGLIPPIERLLVNTAAYFSSSNDLVLAYREFSANPMAAMPSLHAGTPFLVFLIATSLWRWRAAPFFLHAMAGGAAWVYLGEHYIIDVLVGWAVAAVAFAVFWMGLTFLGRLAPSRRASADSPPRTGYRSATLARRRRRLGADHREAPEE